MKKLIAISLIFLFVCYVLPCSAATTIPFQANINVIAKAIDLSFGKDVNKSFSFSGKQVHDDFYQAEVRLNHFKFKLFDIVSNINILVNSEADNKNLKGIIKSEYTLINYKPIRELNGQFKVVNNKLTFENLEFLNFKLSGHIELGFPYHLDLDIGLENLDIKSLSFLLPRDREYNFGCFVDGKIRLTGDLDRLLVKGNIVGNEGNFGKLNFSSLLGRIDGIYPNIDIHDTVIVNEDGLSFKVAGKVDISKTETLAKQIKRIKISPVTKESKSSKEWTIKRLGNDETGTSEIKYFLKKEENVGSSIEKESDMFGLERSMKF